MRFHILGQIIYEDSTYGKERSIRVLGLSVYKRRLKNGCLVTKLFGVTVNRKSLHTAGTPLMSTVGEKLYSLNAVGKAPLVSVIIPVYNAAPYLRECLDSLLAQTLPPAEIICIDDGSIDGSPDILKEYAGRHSVIRLFLEPHAGAAVARNKGLAAARGTYLSILDADDIYAPDMLFKLAARAELCCADVTVCRSQELSPQGDIRPMPWTIQSALLPDAEIFSREDFAQYSFQAFIGWSWDKLFLRDFIMRHHLEFQNIRSSNDALFCFMAIQLAPRITVLDDVLVTHRIHASSLSTTRDKDPLCFIAAIEGIARALHHHDIYEAAKSPFLNWVAEFCLWQTSTISEEHRKAAVTRLQEAILPELLAHDDSFFYNGNTRTRLKHLAQSA